MGEITSIVVFGGASNVGLQILKRGIMEGLEVTAFVHTQKVIPSSVSRELNRVIEGDVLNQEAVENAIKGHDAVLSALEQKTWLSGKNLLSQGCQNIIAGMKKHNVSKLAIVSNACVLPGQNGFFCRLWIRWAGYTDHVKVVELLERENSSIDWVAMMAPKIKNSTDMNPEYKVERNNMPGEWSVTTGELADFMVKLFMDRTSTECFRHNKLGISSRSNKSSRGLFTTVAFCFIIAVIGVALHSRLLPVVLQEFLDEVMGHDAIPN